MIYELGDYVEIEKGFIEFISLEYEPCPCQDLLPLSKESELFLYLKNHCQGWSESSHGHYTLNYILTVLFKNWNQKKLIVDRTYLRLDEDESFIFTLKDPLGWAYFGTPQQWAPLERIRPLIASKFFNIKGNEYMALFLCNNDLKSFLKKTFKWESIPKCIYEERCVGPKKRYVF